ncbi:MAG TPA: hypothetical protein DGT21_01525 [Armatimonadetes bacterium]|jgi:hypothetical protein|nr:hypothetical protein [Armatimonadota bacterium]
MAADSNPLSCVDVTAFGARGDGLTDDAPAIQQAIDASRGLVFIPQGDYRLGCGLRMDLSERGRTRLWSAGARLINASSDAAITIVGSHEGTASPESASEQTYSRELMPVISDLEISGEGQCGDGIVLHKTFKATISRVTVRGCRTGIRLAERNRNAIISNSHIYHNRDIGILYDQVSLHQSNIVGCHISYNGHAGIKVDRGDIRNIQITGNDIEYNNRAEDGEPCADVWLVAGPPPGTGVREGAICSNTIQATRSEGGANVRLQGLEDTQSQKVGLLSITGNLISSQDYNILAENARAVAVTGNTFVSGYTRNIRLSRCRNFALSGNVIDAIPDYGEQTCGGVELVECTNCSVNSLILDGATPPGAEAALALTSCTACSLCSCQVMSPAAEAISLKDCHNCWVAHCILQVDPDADEAIAMHGGARNQITGNMVLE